MLDEELSAMAKEIHSSACKYIICAITTNKNLHKQEKNSFVTLLT